MTKKEIEQRAYECLDCGTALRAITRYVPKDLSLRIERAIREAVAQAYDEAVGIAHAYQGKDAIFHAAQIAARIRSLKDSLDQKA